MKLLAFLRSILSTFLIPFTVLITGPLAILFHFCFHNKKIDDMMIVIWGKACCWLSGVDVIVEGLENIPQDEGCVFLFNHSSFFDVFALAGYIPGLRFGAKAELYKIPVFGHAMTAMGTLPIARNNREEVYKIYENAKSRILNKEKFALAPEGGRFYGPQLGSFKAGPFIFAMSADALIVPVVIIGAYECLPKGHFLFNKNKLKSQIHLKILKPVSSKGYETTTRHELQKIVYDQMNPLWVESFK